MNSFILNYSYLIYSLSVMAVKYLSVLLNEQDNNSLLDNNFLRKV